MTILTYFALALIVASTDVLLSHLKGIEYNVLPSLLLALFWPITCTAVLILGILNIQPEKYK